jgi:transposase
MLNWETRTAILRLKQEGHGIRTIARAVGVSRNAVKRVIRDGLAQVPKLLREESLTEHLDRVRELHRRCEGNLVRVAEMLAAEGIAAHYSTLTAFCRRHDIGVVPKEPAGRYHFEPGEEMQHDTSPHVVTIDNARKKVECASLVLCYSRRIYAQAYPRWTRFECRVFLTKALARLGGACARTMVDNSSVVIWRGVGADAVPAPTMAALAGRFGFEFVAHRVGDANRSARVERPFHYIENNFYPGRTFADLADLNAQLEAWCDAVDRRPKRHLGATPLELFAAEQSCLKPLPVYIPDVYDIHSRRIDVEGFVTLHTNRYSVPASLIGRRIEVHETIDQLRIFDGHNLIAEHDRLAAGLRRRVLLAEHRGQRRSIKPAQPSAEEKTLRVAHSVLGELCERLRRRYGGQALKAVRRLHRMYIEYPTEPLCDAVTAALAYDLIDLGRIERMALTRIAGDFFRLPTDSDDKEDPSGKEDANERENANKEEDVNEEEDANDKNDPNER